MNVLKYAGACVFVIQIKMVNLSLKKFFKKCIILFMMSKNNFTSS